MVLSLAVYGTVALAQEQPGAGISTVSASLPAPTSDSQPLEVQVIAQQWWFTYRYPTYGGIETAELVLPVGQKIQFHITSLDVVHSFWFYALGVKADAVPLNDNVFTVTPNADRDVPRPVRGAVRPLARQHGGQHSDGGQPNGLRRLDPTADDARRADHEVPAAIQPHVRAATTDLRVVIVLNSQLHERTKKWTL